MALKQIDQTTPQPNGKFGDPAKASFRICNENAAETETRLVALNQGISDEAAARIAGDQALGQRIDAELPALVEQVEQVKTEVEAMATELRTEVEAALVTVDNKITEVDTKVDTALAEVDQKIEQLETDIPVMVDTAIAGRIPGKNRLINGNFDIYQRGNPGTVTNTAAYTADRWICSSAGAGATSNWGLGATAPGEIQDSIRFLGFNVVAGVLSAWVGQWIEGVNSLAGGKATVSFWMRSGVAGKKVGLLIQQHFGTGGSAMVEVQSSSVITLTTTFTKYTVTFDVPSIVGKTVGNNNALLLTFFYSDDRSSMFGGQLIGQTGLFELGQVQMERGDKATEYDWRPASEELLLCQRYGELIVGEEYPAAAFAANDITTYAKYRVPKRTTPSVAIKATGTWVGNGGTGNVSTLVTGNISTYGFRFDATAFTGSVVAGYAYVLRGTSFFVDAEF